MGEAGERAVFKGSYRQSDKPLPPDNVGNLAPTHLHGEPPATRTTMDGLGENCHIGLKDAAFRYHGRASVEENETGQTSDEMISAVDSMAPLTQIDLSRHQISDDGAAALALALRNNVLVEVKQHVVYWYYCIQLAWF